MRLFLFSLAAGDDDRGSAKDEHDTGDVEDRGTDAAGGGIITAKKTDNNQAKLQQILLYDRRLATAYRLKEGLRAIFHLPAEEVHPALEKWRRRAWSCRIPEFVDLQRKIRRHMNAIVATVTHQISNARVEAANNKIKLTIRMAYGFRNIDNLIAMIYLRCGGRVIYLPGRATGKVT
ncbi:MAG: transposase [Clostridia bacterium]|nr:transposase [Clostridia bacterium]